MAPFKTSSNLKTLLKAHGRYLCVAFQFCLSENERMNYIDDESFVIKFRINKSFYRNLIKKPEKYRLC